MAKISAKSKNSKNSVLKLLALSVLVGESNAFTGSINGVPSANVGTHNSAMITSRSSLTQVSMSNDKKNRYIQSQNQNNEMPGDGFDTEFDSYFSDAKARRDAAYFAASQGKQPPVPPSTMKDNFGPPIVNSDDMASTASRREQPAPADSQNEPRRYTQEEKRRAMQEAVERQMKVMAASSEDAQAQLEAYYASQGKPIPQADGTMKDPNEGLTPEEIEERDTQVARQRMLTRMKSEQAAGGFIPSTRASDDYLDALKVDAVEKREKFFSKYQPGEQYQIEGLDGFVSQFDREVKVTPPHLTAETTEDLAVNEKERREEQQKQKRTGYQQLLQKAKQSKAQGQMVPPPAPQPTPEVPPAPVSQVVPPPAPQPTPEASPAPVSQTFTSASPPQDLLSETADKLSQAMSGSLNAAEARSLKEDLLKVKSQLVAEAQAAQQTEQPVQPPPAASAPVQPEPVSSEQETQGLPDELDVEGMSSMKSYLQALKAQLEEQRAKQQQASEQVPDTSYTFEEEVRAEEPEPQKPQINFPEVDSSEEAIQMRHTNNLLMIHLNDPLEFDDLVRLQESLKATLDIVTSQIKNSQVSYDLMTQENVAIPDTNAAAVPVEQVVDPVPSAQSTPVLVPEPEAPVQEAAPEAVPEAEEDQNEDGVKKGVKEGAEYMKLAKAFGLLVKHRGGGPFGLGRLEGIEATEMRQVLEEACQILDKETTDAFEE